MTQPGEYAHWKILSGPQDLASLPDWKATFRVRNQHTEREEDLEIELKIILKPDPHGARHIFGRLLNYNKPMDILGVYAPTDPDDKGWIMEE